MTKEAKETIGRASATEQRPNTADRFQFWIKKGGRINPFDIVSAEHHGGSETFGLVTAIRHLTDSSSHLANYISNDFGERLIEEPQTLRQGTNVAEATVLANTHDVYMPVQNEATVSFADEESIHRALGIDGIPEERRVPAGVVEMSNGAEAVAYLDRHFVLGPEAGHVNISGISGLATKTSYAMFLIQSLLQRTENEEVPATILLNVKYDDLLSLHEPAELSDEEKEKWRRMGLEPKPWPRDRVHYLLPNGPRGNPNSYVTLADLPQAQIYGYELNHCASKLDLLLSDIPDAGGTLESVIGEVESGLTSNDRLWQSVETWADLLNGPPLVQQGMPQKLRSIHASSVGRFLRLMRSMVRTRQSGIFVDRLSNKMTTIAETLADLQAGHTYVIDVARLKAAEQTLVFGDVLRTVYELCSGEFESEIDDSEPPKKVIIFVDELNKYAPARQDQAASPILTQVLDIAERGRSFGIILFSAQQFLSAVHQRVTGNAATKILGRSDSAEISQPSYRSLEQDVKSYLTRLDKGELILSHPIYRQPIKIRFPRLPYRQGREHG
ncbi:MAG: ATP-binding protein [Acidobacteria bacterium]|nr:MAG: ATP-binding protein [Acidobacteriota bacterium]